MTLETDIPARSEAFVERIAPRSVAVLSPEIAGKIAAGECVERPASVVKELVENSLDAGATRITVEMEDGGRGLIRVTDNGRGMTREDMVLAVQRHATSKLRTLDDLDEILTLGFRGEALPSIAAVSRLEIISADNGENPNRLVMEGGAVEDLSACGAPPGTTISARDLFFNTPARLKFLRSAATEFGHALEHLTRLAISHHEVSFRVIHNGRQALNTPGSTDPLNAIVAAYGPDTAREMVAVDMNAAPFRVRGYVSRPSLTRTNRTQQSFFVNRRWVRNRTLSHALDHAYRTLLTVGRHPIAAVLIETPPDLVDVNVHPTKAEVRFLRDYEVHSAVARAVKDALLATDLVPEVNLGARRAGGASRYPTGDVDGADGPGTAAAQLPLSSFAGPFEDRATGFGAPVSDRSLPGFRGRGPGLQDDDYAEASTAGGSAGAGMDEREAGGETGWGEEPRGEVEFMEGGNDAATAWSTPRWETSAWAAREGPLLERLGTGGPIHGARVVGQLHRCYIVAEAAEGILLIDQHAAHERILYEKFLKRGDEREVQRLVIPITLELGHREAALMTDRLPDFEALGFEVAPFGPQTFLVRSVPLLARRQNYEALLRDLIDELTAADFGRRIRLQRERIAASMACRAAIKQGDLLSVPEMNALIEDMRSIDRPLEVPTNCPHGRPTTIVLSLSQVERLFLRT